MASLSVAVIIVNFNAGNHLRKCVDHLLVQTRRPEKIYILDNNSVCEPLDDEILIHPEINCVQLSENIGFASGNNFIIDRCETDYVALLNPDAYPAVDWLEKLMCFAEHNQEVAAIGSRQLVYGQDNVIDGIGDVYHVSGLVWRNAHGQSLPICRETKAEIFSPCAGSAMYRTCVFQEVGGFDADFFCYVEDVDLGFRLRLAGYDAVMVYDAVVRHVGGATTGGKHSEFAVYFGHRNVVWAFVKNMPGVLFWFFLPLHLFMNLVVVIRFAFLGQFKVILRAKKDAVLGLPMMWKKRVSIQTKRKAKIFDIFCRLDKRVWRDG